MYILLFLSYLNLRQIRMLSPKEMESVKMCCFHEEFLCKQSQLFEWHTRPALPSVRTTVFCIKENKIISKRWKYNLLPRKRVIVFHGQIDNTKLKRDSTSFAKIHCLFVPWHDFYGVLFAKEKLLLLAFLFFLQDTSNRW